MDTSTKPRTMVSLAFEHGQVQIPTTKTKEAVRALMNCKPDEEVCIPSLSTNVIMDPNTKRPSYILKNEEVFFFRGMLLWWAMQEVYDPPRIETVKPIVSLT